MGNQPGKNDLKRGSIVEDKVKDDSSESYEEGTCVDNNMVALTGISKPTEESPITSNADTDRDEKDDDTYMSGLPGETVCEDTVPDNTIPNDGSHVGTPTPDPDHHDNSSGAGKEYKAHESSTVAKPGDDIELYTETDGYEKTEPVSRNDKDPAQTVDVYCEQENISMTMSHSESETSNHFLDITCKSQYILTEYPEPGPIDTFEVEEKEKLDTNHNFTKQYGSICYDSTGQFKKRITPDAIDNRSIYVETELGDNCDSVKPKIYSNVIFLPDKSKGASPKRFGPKRLGSKFDGMKFDDSDSESDAEKNFKNGHIKDDCSKETSQDQVLSELSGSIETNVDQERNKDNEADISNQQKDKHEVCDDQAEESVALQFSEDHFGLYTGCEASGITQVNLNEPVVDVPNEQSVPQSGPFSVAEQLETAPESRYRSPESSLNQLPVPRNENYPEVQNNEQHRINVTTPSIKAQTETPQVQKIVNTIPENEPIEACAICNKLRDECLCLFPKPVFKTVMTLSRYEHSKPVLSYFRYLKFGEKSIDWSKLKSSQAKYAMGLKSLKTSLPDDNRLMLEFKLPPNKGCYDECTESADVELRLTSEKNVAFNEDTELIEFLESRVNLKGVSMSDSFNSNKYVMINDFDDNSDDEVPSNEDDDFDANGKIVRTVISDTCSEETSDETSENCVVYDNVLNDRADHLDDVTEKEKVQGDRNVEMVELENNHNMCFTRSSSSSESTLDDQEPGMFDSPESPVERNESETEYAADLILLPDNAPEDELILDENIGLTNQNMENGESMNAALLNTGDKILSEEVSNGSSGAVKENTINTTVNSSLKRSKTKPEDDNRLQQLSDDEDTVIDSTSGLDNEIESVPEEDHSSDSLHRLKTRSETEIKGDGMRFPFLQYDPYDPLSIDYTLPPDQFRKQLKRLQERREHEYGLDSVIPRFGSQRRGPYRPPAATSAFAASFYECDDHRKKISDLGNKNKSFGDQHAIDQLHRGRSMFSERHEPRIPVYDRSLFYSPKRGSKSDLTSNLPSRSHFSRSDVPSRSTARPPSPPMSPSRLLSQRSDVLYRSPLIQSSTLRSSLLPRSPSPPMVPSMLPSLSSDVPSGSPGRPPSSPRSHSSSRSSTPLRSPSSSRSASPLRSPSSSRSSSPIRSTSPLRLPSPPRSPPPPRPPLHPRSTSPLRSTFTPRSPSPPWSSPPRPPSPEPSTMSSSPPEITSMSRSPLSDAGQKEEVEDPDVYEDQDDSSVDEDLDEIWTSMFEEESIKSKEVHKSLPKCRFTVLCIDTSKSMEGLPWQHVKDFVTKFLSGLEEVKQEYGIQECVAMVTFGHDTKISCHLTDNYQQILNCLDMIQPSGCSPMLVGLLLSLACIGFTVGGDMHTLRLHEIDVSHRVILLSDGYPTPSLRPSDPEEISDTKRLKAITQINDFFEDDAVRGIHICCVPLGDNPNMCVLELLCEVSNGRLYNHTEVNAVIRSTHNHYICAQISHQMFDMPDTDGLDVGMFESMVMDLYPGTSTTDLSEMTKLAQDGYARLATERSGLLDDSDSDAASDTINDNFEPQQLDNLPCIGTRVTSGPDLSHDDDTPSETGTVTGHSHSNKGKVFVQWDSGTEMLCCYGYDDKWEILPNETNEIFSVDDEIKPGNKVRRGPDWSFGNDDGGSDQIGAVYNVCTDGVVWVRWPNGNHGNYRYNQDGMFDVLKSDPVDPTGEETFVALMNERNRTQDEE